MPKTKKKFDWEVYEYGECIDIMSMTRTEAKKYKIQFPQYTLHEIGYTNLLNKQLDD